MPPNVKKTRFPHPINEPETREEKEVEFAALLRTYRQEHLMDYYRQLDKGGKEKLEWQVSSFDWSLLDLIRGQSDAHERGCFSPISVLTASELEKNASAYETQGVEAIRQGEVGAVLLAGGQGSRLGYDGPKGTLNIGKTKDVFVFELMINELSRIARKSGTFVHLYIMTSDLNYKKTTAFFENKDFFGYPEEYIHFFVQENLPAVDLSGKLLMAERDSLAYSPNGNGGWFLSLGKSGLLEHVHIHGIQWLNVFAVDNVLQKVVDPVFIGAVGSSGADCGTKVIRKTGPEEKVGVLCLEDGVPSIVEYYDLGKDMAESRNEDGELTYGFGVTLNYLFRVEALEHVDMSKLPVHLAKKRIPFAAPDGTKIVPKEENGYKFEYLVLDLIKLMKDCLPCEVVREREFAPIKNLTGVDSIETAQALLEKNGYNL